MIAHMELLTDITHRKLGTRRSRPPSDIINLTSDFAEVYSPVADFYGQADIGDTYADYGRVPTEHCMAMSTFRVGCAWRACDGVSNDVFRNRFEFVEIDNIEKVVKRPEIMKWMRDTGFWDQMYQDLSFDRRAGNGYLVAWYPGDRKTEDLRKPYKGSKRPNYLKAHSPSWLFPVNVEQRFEMRTDFRKEEWDFTGGHLGGTRIHHSRIHVLESRYVEGNVRGLSILEPTYTALICFMNSMIFILKALGQTGTATIGVQSQNPIPLATEVQAYLDFLNEMRANKFYVLGKDAKMMIENAASKIGSGVRDYVEFLMEDISSSWIIPKNILFGRSDGGGLDGAGALVSKEDYLASCLSTIQGQLVNDIMKILEDLAGFKDLDNLTLRWNLDLHKTEEQRLKEQIMRVQFEQEELNLKYQKKMIKFQMNMMERQDALSEIQLKQAKLQFNEFEKDPSLLLGNQGETNKQANEDDQAKKPEKLPSVDFTEMEVLRKNINENNQYLNKAQNRRKIWDRK
jgi:hypothetical protein